jgi:putative endonuclease
MSWQRIFFFFRQLRKRWRWQRLRRAHLRLGRRGERAAARLLENTGNEILCRNYRAGRSEIDLVARKNCILCFVEVKTRRYKPGVRPAEAVNAEKRRHIIRGARRYLREIGAPELSIRFDIIEVITQGARIREIRQMKNAFHQK